MSFRTRHPGRKKGRAEMQIERSASVWGTSRESAEEKVPRSGRSPGLSSSVGFFSEDEVPLAAEEKQAASPAAG